MIIRLKYKSIIFEEKKSYTGSISKIFGLGYQRLMWLGSLFGLAVNLKIKYLNNYIFECMFLIIKKNYIIDERLQLMQKKQLKFFINLGIVKGKRLAEGLPIHGQRTHSNHNTPKKNKLVI